MSVVQNKQHGVQSINQRFSQLGIAKRLDIVSANLLLTRINKQDFLKLLDQAEQGNVTARQWIEHNLLKLRNIEDLHSNHDNVSQIRLFDDAPEKAPAQEIEEQPENRNQQHPIHPSWHVYGKSALCFDADATRNGIPTVSIDACPSIAPRKYDWNSKIRIQLTAQELPVVAAVLLGYQKQCEFKNHGKENNKGFSMEDQSDKVFCRVFTRGVVHAVPISEGDRFHVTALFLRQIRLHYKWLDGAAVDMMLRSFKKAA